MLKEQRVLWNEAGDLLVERVHLLHVVRNGYWYIGEQVQQALCAALVFSELFAGLRISSWVGHMAPGLQMKFGEQ